MTSILPKPSKSTVLKESQTAGKVKETAKRDTIKKTSEDKNIIHGFAIFCTICKITDSNSFKSFTDVLSHLCGRRHQTAAWKMLYLKSNTSITFKGEFYYPET